PKPWAMAGATPIVKQAAAANSAIRVFIRPSPKFLPLRVSVAGFLPRKGRRSDFTGATIRAHERRTAKQKGPEKLRALEHSPMPPATPRAAARSRPAAAERPRPAASGPRRPARGGGGPPLPPA